MCHITLVRPTAIGLKNVGLRINYNNAYHETNRVMSSSETFREPLHYYRVWLILKTCNLMIGDLTNRPP